MKRLLIVIVALVIALPGISQVKLNLGIKGGLNLSNFGGDVSNTESIVGYHFGLYAAGKVTKFGGQVEILYSAQGTENPSIDVDNLYVNIPVLAKFYLLQGLHLQLGPQFGILVDSETKDLITGSKSDSKDFYKNGDLSLVAGAGFEISKLQLGARYVIGLSDINDAPSAVDKIKNRTFQLYVGFKLAGK